MDVSAVQPRWVGVGRSAAPDAVEAAGECVREALAGRAAYGEIARTQGVSGCHNQTLVGLAVG